MISETKMRSFIQEQIDSYSKLRDNVEIDRIQGNVSDAYAETVTQSMNIAIDTMRLFLQFYEQRVDLGLLREE